MEVNKVSRPRLTGKIRSNQLLEWQKKKIRFSIFMTEKNICDPIMHNPIEYIINKNSNHCKFNDHWLGCFLSETKIISWDDINLVSDCD